jgi:hypothetical protein
MVDADLDTSRLTAADRAAVEDEFVLGCSCEKCASLARLLAAHDALLSALSAARARADQAERALQEIATGRTSEDDVAGPAQSGWMTAARLCEVARRALAAGENP